MDSLYCMCFTRVHFVCVSVSFSFLVNLTILSVKSSNSFFMTPLFYRKKHAYRTNVRQEVLHFYKNTQGHPPTEKSVQNITIPHTNHNHNIINVLQPSIITSTPPLLLTIASSYSLSTPRHYLSNSPLHSISRSLTHSR